MFTFTRQQDIPLLNKYSLEYNTPSPLYSQYSQFFDGYNFNVEFPESWFVIDNDTESYYHMKSAKIMKTTTSQSTMVIVDHAKNETNTYLLTEPYVDVNHNLNSNAPPPPSGAQLPTILSKQAILTFANPEIMRNYTSFLIDTFKTSNIPKPVNIETKGSSLRVSIPPNKDTPSEMFMLSFDYSTSWIGIIDTVRCNFKTSCDGKSLHHKYILRNLKPIELDDRSFFNFHDFSVDFGQSWMIVSLPDSKTCTYTPLASVGVVKSQDVPVDYPVILSDKAVFTFDNIQFLHQHVASLKDEFEAYGLSHIIDISVNDNIVTMTASSQDLKEGDMYLLSFDFRNNWKGVVFGGFYCKFNNSPEPKPRPVYYKYRELPVY